jgi:uridine phosphorylase
MGATWTTDAPYRETREEILKYQAEGVQVVEMEIASLFSVAQVRGVESAGLVVVADKLANLKWEMPEDMRAINNSFEAAYRAAIAALNEDG